MKLHRVASWLASIRAHDWRALALPASLLVFWSLASLFDWVNPRLIPSPLSVLEVAWTSLLAEDFLSGVWGSLYRDLGGFVIGACLGGAVGVALGLVRLLDQLFSPTLNALKQISLFAWLPLISSWFGYDDGAKILFIAASTFYPVVVNTFDGVRGIARHEWEVARVYRFTTWQLITRLVLPSAAPRILAGLQLGLVFAWLATIGSEFLLANWGSGLGNIVIRGREGFNVALVIVGMLVIGLVGALLNRLAQAVEDRLLVWRRSRT